ncbi:hypothetical protein BX666DRAFT_852710 [Dichotomocladium elegans]|nr:hypothetical protein BX666DRAFT_852710 [Dichotomocladium elegans]
MSESRLFQFGQAPLPTPFTHDPRLIRRYFPIRKNACLVCSICFTCSRMYGAHCICQEVQPRRGKNLPAGSLDSRAKKLHPQDKDDYEFSLKWLSEHAHAMYRDQRGNVVGLRDLSEVSLCKAHSSTLYRAKKRHERSKNQAPPSPADSNGLLDMMDHDLPPPSSILEGGGIATKVRELSNHHSHIHAPAPLRWSSPDLHLQPSSSFKRKRTSTTTTTTTTLLEPHSSASTPLLYGSATPPPPPVSSASSRFATPSLSSSPHRHHQQLPPLHRSSPIHTSGSSSSSSYSSMIPIFKQDRVLETVSLKAPDSRYYLRNLAITDSFTFRDLLKEIDLPGPPPHGKRIVVSDAKNETIFPLDQAIRSVIQRPASSHVDLYLGLSDNPSIDWSTYV